MSRCVTCKLQRWFVSFCFGFVLLNGIIYLTFFELGNETSVPVFYRRIKYRFEFGCERVRILYSAIKHGNRCFVSILRRLLKTNCVSIMRCTSFFRKPILTGCCLVTRTVKVISTDLFIN